MSAPAKKASKPKAPAAHPKYSVMIAAAITSLKDRTGSSRQAILKYICANYKVDAANSAVRICLALKHGVDKHAHQQTRQSLDYDMRDANKDPTNQRPCGSGTLRIMDINSY